MNSITVHHACLHCTDVRFLYWSSLGPTPTIHKASMDGSGASAVLSISNVFVFTIDHTQQLLYWIINNGFGCRNDHVMGYSNVDGSGRGQTVVNSNCFLFGYNPQAIDFFRGTLYSYSGNYHFRIFKTIPEGETITFRFDGNYMSECPSPYTGMKVISDQRQLQGYCIYFNNACIRVPPSPPSPRKFQITIGF